jgi:integrase
MSLWGSFYVMSGVHTLRRTVFTSMLEGKIPAKDVQQWAGHRDFRTTKKYYDIPSEKPLPSEADAVSRALWGV